MKKAVMDGNTAAAYASYTFTEVAAIFPITPSSVMAECVDEWAANGQKNIFGQTVDVVEMQSEGGAAGTVHGSLSAGALTTTYTASQGLLLMIPNIYKVAGELEPGVFHVSARTVSAHALSIFGDHSDVMACRQTGVAMLASASPQEAMDLGNVAHLSAIKSSVPFMHFFDGFRTSHELQKIDVLEADDVAPLLDMDAVDAFRKRALNPERPTLRGTTQNPDIFFQQKEAVNQWIDRVPEVVAQYMKEINKITGRNYDLFDYYGAEDAEYVAIAMGSACETMKETVDYLMAKGQKVAMINVHLYRPFAIDRFMAKIPATVKRIAVLDRCKESGSIGDPLYLDVVDAFYESDRKMEIIAGRYGLSSKDTTPAQIEAVYKNLMNDQPKDHFTVGINDDVTNHSLPMNGEINVTPEGTVSCKLWGLGSDGTVGANKNSIKIIGDNTDMYAQAYFVYDSKKSGGLTQSHLRFGKQPIRSPYLVTAADFVACSAPSYVTRYDMTEDLKDGGIFLLNCIWNKDEIGEHIPDSMKRGLADKNAQFYIIDAINIAKKLGLRNRTNSILQASFFKLLGVLPIDKAEEYMKKAIIKSYSKKGQNIVDMNIAAISSGITELVRIDIPEEWYTIEPEEEDLSALPKHVREVVVPVNKQQGDKLPVSVFMDKADGTFKTGTTAYEKRGTAVDVPEWQPENCIQCNRCSAACPHAAIRPYLLNEEEKAAAPAEFISVPAKGKGLEKYEYRLQISALDCTGCGSCSVVCPAKEKALVMKPLESQLCEKDNWTFATEEISDKNEVRPTNVKNSQFSQPLFEFPAACGGCGETPYIKLATQLFGDTMYIANASGCSSAYGGSTPTTPYCMNKKGHGPTWAMSLFEDNAEYAFGMMMGAEKQRDRLAETIIELRDAGVCQAECDEWIASRKNRERSAEATDDLVAGITDAREQADPEVAALIDAVLKDKEFLRKKSFWAFGGDGWAYDIGYGGLDHVIAEGLDVNILVLDTEVYSNTGGQSSKSTPTGAIAKFAAAGKKTRKKDLGMMAMSYGYVYVAQVAMGYDPEQTLKAMKEAEAYDGPSIIICYCPCIEHGIKEGMCNSQIHMKKAVEAGYWHLYRFNPDLKAEGKNPFILDSKEPTGDFEDFILGENRYASLKLQSPDTAEKFFAKTKADAEERYQSYLKLATQKSVGGKLL